MVCCQNRGLPCFYNTFPGSIVDVSTLKNLLKYPEEYKLQDFILIMDGGFFTTSNILSIVNSPMGITVLQPVSFSLKKTKELVSQHAKSLRNTDTTFRYNEEIMHRLSVPICIENQQFTAHIFFNERVELDQRHHFPPTLLDIESEHKTGKFDSQADAQTCIDLEIPEKLSAFFCWDASSKAIVKNDAKIKENIAKLGYFIIMTYSQDMDKQTILHYYRDKDKVEKIFNSSKEFS
ncbi:hypothetical protein EZS27_015621 [termite gut metagenome]|uniref:Transposase IS4-like domain-containing protein n=1 Tax=termite gut metagenome TaxID=433724 RepID=A0A5J4RSD2_9ZZZZ